MFHSVSRSQRSFVSTGKRQDCQLSLSSRLLKNAFHLQFPSCRRRPASSKSLILHGPDFLDTGIRRCEETFFYNLLVGDVYPHVAVKPVPYRIRRESGVYRGREKPGLHYPDYPSFADSLPGSPQRLQQRPPEAPAPQPRPSPNLE
jgi:hypothetical protein